MIAEFRLAKPAHRHFRIRRAVKYKNLVVIRGTDEEIKPAFFIDTLGPVHGNAVGSANGKYGGAHGARARPTGQVFHNDAFEVHATGKSNEKGPENERTHGA